MRRRLRKRKQVTWHQKNAHGDRKIITRIGLSFADQAEAYFEKTYNPPKWELAGVGGRTYRKYIENLNL